LICSADFLCIDRLVAGRATSDVLDGRIAAGVNKCCGGGVTLTEFVTPLHDGDEYWRQAHSCVAQSVFKARRTVLVLDLVEDPVVDETRQAVSQQVRGNTEVITKFTESTKASKHATQDQQRPAITDDRKRSGDRVMFVRLVHRVNVR